MSFKFVKFNDLFSRSSEQYLEMASRGGQMVAGTDGQDFQHRERVAGQYSVSAANKARMKGLVVVHLVLGVVHLVRLLPSILPLLGISAPLPLPTLPIPHRVFLAGISSLCPPGSERLQTVQVRPPASVSVGVTGGLHLHLPHHPLHPLP